MQLRRMLIVCLAAAAACEPEARDTTIAASGSSETGRRPYAVGSCAHDPCATGTKLTSGCDACVRSICAQDSYCCSTKWDAQCVNEVGSICAQTCGGGGSAADMSVGCAHDVCTSGAKLTASCSSCASQICAADSYCCNSSWDSQCVGEVASVCSQSCSVGGGPPPDMSTPPTGGGGARLKFAVFGDCRPPNVNGTSNYPSAIIGGIFSLAQQLGAQLVIGTGDYMFATTATAVSAQVKLFQAARANYPGPIYLTMGNHECNGYTASNCPLFNETANVKAFVQQLLPSGITSPYYRIDVATPFGTAKLIFIAANAWSTAQESWLAQQLADPTPYTFVMRHEPSADTSAPGVAPSEKLVSAAPYTLELLGHTHEYKRVDTTHVISGNAGAPLQPGSSGFGLLIVEQLADGNVSVTEIDEASGAQIDTWTVTPSGAAVP
jgi:hypothetical protein